MQQQKDGVIINLHRQGPRAKQHVPHLGGGLRKPRGNRRAGRLHPAPVAGLAQRRDPGCEWRQLYPLDQAPEQQGYV